MDSQHVIIIGGTSGIGLETARVARQESCRVTVTGRDDTKFDHARGFGLDCARLDAGDPQALAAFFAAQGSFDHLVVCASGAKGGGPFRTLDLADLRAGFDGKFWPQVNALQAALPTIRSSGSITLVSAISSRALQPGTAGLAAINMAIEAMIPILASELRPLRVNAVAPGVIDTPWWNHVPQTERQKLFDQMGAAVPAGRVGQPADIAQAIIMLMNNGFMTGTVIDCDGGWKLKAA